MNFIDRILNSTTMYRLVLYVLLLLLGLGAILSFFNLLPFTPLPLIFTSAVLVAVAYLTNEVLARIFKAPVNFESIFITALILALIISPINSLSDLPALFLVAVLAPVSKFILAVNHKHIFNPAAFTVALVPLVTTFGPSWWVGEPVMLAPTILGGFLIVRKLKRWDLVLSFLLFFSLVTANFSANSLILFFATVMLTEPQTTPPTRILRILYGGLVGVILGSNFNIGPFYTTPEVSLVLGNIFSFVVSPKEKLILSLLKKIKYSADLYDFVFESSQRFSFLPGQFMEWTLPLKNLDSRGNRRFFTLASSPTEGTLRIGVRFTENGSAFKKQLLEMKEGEKIVTSSLSGSFILPSDTNQKLCFIAGGIGITPYRAMIKYLLDQRQQRNIVLFYSVKTEDELVYSDIFDQAKKKLGIKVVYVETQKQGYINEDMIKGEVPDYRDRVFYISGPHGMVDAYEQTLKDMGISNSQIKIDFFPGYA